MAYPTRAQIETVARGLGVDAEDVYAFASVYGRLPTSAGELGTFQRAVEAGARAIGERVDWGWVKRFYYGFATRRGQVCANVADYVAYLNQIGMRNPATGAICTGPNCPIPRPGDGYPPGGAATDPPAAGTPGSTPGGSPGSNPNPSPLAVLNKIPSIALIAGAIGVTLFLAKRR